MKPLLALVLACAALVLAAPATPAERVVERGIVQSLAPTSVVLRALDGSDVTVTLGPATRYRLNGRAATYADIRPGLVAEAVSGRAGIALVLRAFGRQTESGVLVRRQPGVIVLRRPSGERVRVVLTSRTAVWLEGRRVARRMLRRGTQLDVTLARDGSARKVVVRTAGG